MRIMTRRDFLRGSALSPFLFLPAGGPRRTLCLLLPRPTDIRIEDISYTYEDFRYRAPLKFGGAVVDRVTLLNVHCVARTAGGRAAKGFGSMPLAAAWAFPSKGLSYDTTLGAMKTLAERIAKLTAACKEAGHPIDLNRLLEPSYLEAAAAVSKELKLPEPIPKLCTLVTVSPFDAALHNTYGKAHGLNCYRTYGADFMVHDLAHYLGPEFKGEYLSQYILRNPKPRMPMYHLVGAVDPIVEADIKQRLNDGLPETLPEWINYNGLTHLKIKLNGDDLDWDVERVVCVNRATAETQAKRGVDLLGVLTGFQRAVSQR